MGNMIKGIHNQVNEVSINGAVAQIEKIKMGDNSPQILGDVRLDDNTSVGDGGRGVSS
ncbi:hypothetical protein SAY87_014933 [Trapa incisa]|uniref:Uncharacterized protein n=1 Tax=Trapa incisa TaxID=236973 RepID=A0AAN7H396_9MYRT|nr:hypothetical protein SAY87_014933 [Trapa incisa]